MKSPYDLTNQTFGKWKVITRAPNYRGNARWNTLCECGRQGVVWGRVLRNGKSLSCKTCANTIHGFSGSRTHTIWMNMIGRCSRATHKDWNLYGGRGIYVCDRGTT